MDTTKTCQHCGKPIGPKAIGGLCPECMMKVGLGSGIHLEGDAEPGAKRPPAPTIAEIAKHFPQLEILELLGAGGMGAVYKARQRELDRLVALKVLPQQAGHDPGFAERFTREARALAKLSHPNIVALYEFGQVSGAGVLPAAEAAPETPAPLAAPRLHYFIMEFVDGLSLRQMEQAGKLSPRQALQIIPQMCEALQFAHDEGVVHRDIKPENVLLDKKGRVKIADFGLAKILGFEPKDLRLTGARDVMGTPHYMAPEQVEHPQAVDHRADIYSLGVVFYEMLTGELPLGKFQAPSQKVQMDVRFDEVVLHALAKEPERRYQHASEVKTDVETIATTPTKVPTPEETVSVSFTPSTRDHFCADALPSWVVAVRYTARILGTLCGLMFLFFLAGEGSPPIGSQPVAVQVEFAAVAILLAGFVAGWWRDGWAALLTLAGWTLFHLAERHVPAWSVFHVGAIVGGLFALAWAGSHKRMAVTAVAAFPLIFGAGMNLTHPRPPSRLAGGVETQAASSVAVPPVVIQTVPESGADKVDPALTELRVTFSKPMQNSGWSWNMVGQETFPEATGQPRYLADGCTCVLPVKLEPGKLYATWLNRADHTNFTDIEGQAALPYLLIFETRK